MKPALYAVVLAGGRGERFWPVGRHSRPKQFVDLFGGKPLIRHAIDRLKGLVRPENILVVTSSDLVPATRKALPNLPPENILGEPVGRDTAAACATATAWVAWKGGDLATMCILTADHLIADPAGFRAVLANASKMVAERPVMSVIGIKPTYPATGYGYIELGKPVSGKSLPRGFRSVKRFVEKPNLGTAATYVKSGRFLWNSGMFVWRVDTFLAALAAYCPQLNELVGSLRLSFGTKGFARCFAAQYRRLGKISVDYAVMEHAQNLVVAAGDFGWDDVGTWVSAAAHFAQDADGNAHHGASQMLASHGNAVVNTEAGHLVALLGCDDLVVVHTGDATLVCTKEAADGLKALVKEIGADPARAKFIR